MDNGLEPIFQKLQKALADECNHEYNFYAALILPSFLIIGVCLQFTDSRLISMAWGISIGTAIMRFYFYIKAKRKFNSAEKEWVESLTAKCEDIHKKCDHLTKEIHIEMARAEKAPNQSKKEKKEAISVPTKLE